MSSGSSLPSSWKSLANAVLADHPGKSGKKSSERAMLADHLACRVIEIAPEHGPGYDPEWNAETLAAAKALPGIAESVAKIREWLEKWGEIHDPGEWAEGWPAIGTNTAGILETVEIKDESQTAGVFHADDDDGDERHQIWLARAGQNRWVFAEEYGDHRETRVLSVPELDEHMYYCPPMRRADLKVLWLAELLNMPHHPVKVWEDN
jgi:hypothetical protein